VAAGQLTLEASNRELFLQATPEGPSGVLPSTAIRSVRTSPGTGIARLDPAEPKQAAPPPKVAEKPIPAKEEPAEASGLRDTEIRGGGDNPEFRDVGREGYFLVGLELGIGKFLNKDIVVAIRPIYRKGEWEYRGKPWGNLAYKTVKTVAKPGYAIGGIKIKTGLGVDGLSVTYMKITKAGTALDSSDSHESDWIGGTRSKTPFRIAEDGDPCVGIVGKTNAKGELNGLGLVQKPSKEK